jgi:hypothetical protein
MNVQYVKAPFQDKTLAELYKMVCKEFHLSEMDLKELEAAVWVNQLQSLRDKQTKL